MTRVATIATRIAAAEQAVRDAYLRGGPITDTIAQREHRDALLEASLGRNTIMFGEGGHPNVLVRVPAYNMSELGLGLPARTHPGFILAGQARPEVWVGKYQLRRVGSGLDARVATLPGLDPTTSIDWDESFAAADQNGEGWHLLSNATWAAIALQAHARGHAEHGNDNYGRSYDDHSLQGVRGDGGEPGVDDDGDERTLTGSGPLAWRHDGTAAGIADLVGNVWEWVAGMRINEGEINIIPDTIGADGVAVDHGAASEAWQAIMPDGTLVAPGAAGALHYDLDESTSPVLGTEVTTVEDYGHRPFRDLVTTAGTSVPPLLEQLMLFPSLDPSSRGRIYVRPNGERLPRRGGNWLNASNAGWSALNVDRTRSDRDSFLGSRAAFVAL